MDIDPIRGALDAVRSIDVSERTVRETRDRPHVAPFVELGDADAWATRADWVDSATIAAARSSLLPGK